MSSRPTATFPVTSSVQSQNDRLNDLFDGFDGVGPEPVTEEIGETFAHHGHSRTDGIDAYSCHNEDRPEPHHQRPCGGARSSHRRRVGKAPGRVVYRRRSHCISLVTPYELADLAKCPRLKLR